MLTPHRVSDIDCARVLAEFNCGSNTLNRSGSSHSMNRHMAEISNQSDESSKSSPISVIYNVCDNDEPSCCDVESFMTSLAQDLKTGESDSVQSTHDELTVGENGTLVTDNSSDVCDSESSEGGHVEEENSAGAAETYVRAEGCLNNSNSGTEDQIKNVQQSQQNEPSSSQQPHARETESSVHVKSGTSNSAETFNTFQYWRIPVPELQLDAGLAETGGPPALLADETARQTSESELDADMDIDTELDNLSIRLEECSLQYPGEGTPHSAEICVASVAMVADADKQGSKNHQDPSGKLLWKEKVEYKEDVSDLEAQQQYLEALPSSQVSQDIVPQALINHFVSMTNPSQAQNTDNEIAHHCAFSLPAVALTLGRKNWILLKNAYDRLASDMQWKVRHIVASSIHELAVILGEDLATEDLVPVFSGFMKDLDEVRIGALKHLADFLKFLRPPDRNLFLPRLSEFLLTDNEWNWRFREELAEQLLAAVNLFTPEDSRRHLTPIAISLLLDKVAAVRQVALSLVTELVKHVSTEPVLLRGLLGDLAEWFAHSKRWNQRQTFALLCSQLVTKRVLSEELFACDVLPHLLDLSWDSVPNVRLSVARTVATNIMAQEFFCSAENPHHEVLTQVLKRLQGDKDRDVRYFASLCPSSTDIEEVSVAGNS